MKRFSIALAGTLLTAGSWGCGSGEPAALPANPQVDTRPAEVKEADDAMARKAMEQAGKKP